MLTPQETVGPLRQGCVQDDRRLEKRHLLECQLSFPDAEPRLCLCRPGENSFAEREGVLGDAGRSLRGGNRERISKLVVTGKRFTAYGTRQFRRSNENKAQQANDGSFGI